MVGHKTSAEYVPLSRKDDSEVVFDVDDHESLEAQSHHAYAYPSGTLPKYRRLCLGRKRVLLILVLLAGFYGLASQWFEVKRPISSKSKVAFVTLLSAQDDTYANKNGHEASINDDNYFVATRMLGYQLMHDPQTRTSLGAPFVVITTPQVEQAKIDRLKKDGAIVWPMPESSIPLNHTQSSKQSAELLSKLLVWEWTQFERVVYLDNDVILNRPLDTIFDDPHVAALRSNSAKQSAILQDEAPQPSEYLFAPLPGKLDQTSGAKHPSTAFFVLKPDRAMWNYFLSIFAKPGKLGSTVSDQTLLEYVFRPEGNMPSAFLEPHWSLHRPTTSEAADKAMSIRHKWWWLESDSSTQRFDLGLQLWMRSWRWKMEGYYQALDDVASRRLFSAVRSLMA